MTIDNINDDVEIFNKISAKIHELKGTNSSIEPEVVRECLVKEGLVNFISGISPINFGDAEDLDFAYFNKSGKYWAKAFSFPKEGQIFYFEKHNKKYRAYNCGVFTCDLEVILD